MDFSKIKSELENSTITTGNRYTGIGEKTILNYMNKLKKIDKDDGFKDILNYLNGIENNNSKLAYQTAILGTAKHSPLFVEYLTPEVINDVREQQVKFLKEEKPLTIKQVKTDREEENWVDWKDLLKLSKKKLEDDGITQDNILIGIYTLIPPSRLDFHNLLIVKHSFTIDDPKQNYIRISSKTKMKIFLQDYKTSKTHGTIEIDVPLKLAKMIYEYLSPMSQRKYLFEKSGNGNKPFASPETFAKYLKDVFKQLTDRNVSVDLLRHSYITNFRKGDKSLSKKEKVAKQMGNSVAVQEEYRRVD